MILWINADNKEKIFELLEATKNKYDSGNLELTRFNVYNIHEQTINMYK